MKYYFVLKLKMEHCLNGGLVWEFLGWKVTNLELSEFYKRCTVNPSPFPLFWFLFSVTAQLKS